MSKSTVYFFVVLTLLSLGLILVPSAYSQTQDIKVVSYSYYIDSLGYLDVVGEVENVGPNTVNPVFLTGSIISTAGTDLSDSYCQVWVSYLQPQQEAPFYMEFQPPSSTGIWEPSAIAKVDLTVYQANATESYQYPDLKITSSKGAVGTVGAFNGAYTVTGTIENTGDQTAQNITVVGAFFNSTGTVVAVGYTDYLIPVALVPSNTTTFQISAFDLNQTIVPASEKIKSYSLLVQTELPILQGTAPIITPTPGSSSSPSATSSSSPSATSSSSPAQKAVNSNSSSTVAAIGIVIVIVILAIAGILLAFRKRKPPATVKEAIKARKKNMA